MLFDPFEEEFHFPAGFVDMGNNQSREGEVVGEENQNFVCLSIVELNPAKFGRVIFGGIESSEYAGLIAYEAAGPIHTAAFVLRKAAHGNSSRQRSMVVE